MRNDGGRERDKSMHGSVRRRAGKQGKIHGGEGWLERDAATRGREESGRRRRVEKGDGEVHRGMGGGRRLPRLKWNIDLWRRAQPLQPTRPCPPFSADLSPLWTPPKFVADFTTPFASRSPARLPSIDPPASLPALSLILIKREIGKLALTRKICVVKRRNFSTQYLFTRL